MIRITLVGVGKKAPAWVQAGYLEYARRLPREISLGFLEISPARRGKGIPVDRTRLKEAEAILKEIPENHRVIVLDERGERHTTAVLAERLREWRNDGLNTCFIIGGPDGLHDSVIDSADECWSLSDYTLPHAMVRIILVEQIYRAWCILKNHPYHRESPATSHQPPATSHQPPATSHQKVSHSISVIPVINLNLPVMTALYLASRSPRRRLLLSKLTADFSVIEVETDEVPGTGEPPADYVRRAAVDKALAARKRLGGNRPILSADTEVICGGKIMGKPGGPGEAVDMLLSLSGKTHDVYTAVVLLTDRPHCIINHNRLRFRQMERSECEHYCRQLIPLDKAGAYGIQDTAAAFIDRFEGSYTGVMGLPLVETRKLLEEAGIEI